LTNKHDSHAPSAYKPLESMPDPTLQPERVLWLHVTAQAVIDAASRDRAIKREVAEWVKHEDFEIVCGMAGIEPSYVSHLISALLKDRNRKRAFKKAMEFRFLVRTYVESHTGDIDKRRGA
jgi:hypothetical protein